MQLLGESMASFLLYYCSKWLLLYCKFAYCDHEAATACALCNRIKRTLRVHGTLKRLGYPHLFTSSNAIKKLCFNAKPIFTWTNNFFLMSDGKIDKPLFHVTTNKYWTITLDVKWRSCLSERSLFTSFKEAYLLKVWNNIKRLFGNQYIHLKIWQTSTLKQKALEKKVSTRIPTKKI